MTRRTFSSSLLAAVAAPALPMASAAVPIERVARHVLANGLEVVVIPDHRVPVATHMLWYKVGSADEPAGKSGIAHFLEHLMFKGTRRHPGDTFSRAVAAVGGSENAFTSYDYTGYFQRVARDELAGMMAFEADRMTGLELNDAVVASERDVVLEERRSRTDNDPGARLSERMSNRLWTGHPYGIPVIGWEEEIRALNREDALAFYRRHYAPNNAVLVVAGDTELDEVVRFAEASYGQVPRSDVVAPRLRPPSPARGEAERVRLADARVAQPSLTQVVIVPSYRTAAPGEAEAFEILAHAAGSTPSGRLYRALVTEQQIAVNAGAFYSGAALGDGRFGLFATPRPGIGLDRIEAAIAVEAERIAKEGVTGEELARAKTKLVADSIFSQDSQAAMARMYGASLVCGSTIEDLLEWVARVRRVTAAEVHKAAGRAFDLSRAVVGELVRGEPG